MKIYELATQRERLNGAKCRFWALKQATPKA